MTALVRRAFVAYLALLLLIACSAAPELQTVSYQKLASFQVPKAWGAARRGGG